MASAGLVVDVVVLAGAVVVLAGGTDVVDDWGVGAMTVVVGFWTGFLASAVASHGTTGLFVAAVVGAAGATVDGAVNVVVEGDGSARCGVVVVVVVPATAATTDCGGRVGAGGVVGGAAAGDTAIWLVAATTTVWGLLGGAAVAAGNSAPVPTAATLSARLATTGAFEESTGSAWATPWAAGTEAAWLTSEVSPDDSEPPDVTA